MSSVAPGLRGAAQVRVAIAAAAPWIALAVAAAAAAWAVDGGRTYFLDPDSHYHVKMGALLLSGRLPDQLVWASGTTLAQSFADREWLFHALLGAAGWLTGDDVLGARCVQSALQLGVVASVTLAARRAGVRRAWIAGFVLLAAGHGFLWRFALVRPHLVAEILLPWVVVLSMERRATALGCVSFVYAAAYSGSALAPAAAAAVASAAALRGERRAWRMPVASLLGVAAGLTLHPSFPRAYTAWFTQNFSVPWIAWTAAPGAYKRPLELAPTTLPELAGSCPVALCAAAVPLVLAALGSRALGRPARLFAVAAGAAVAMSLWSVRFIEYLAPLAGLAAAAAASDVLDASLRPRRAIVVAAACGLAAASVGVQQWRRALETLAHADAAPATAAARWLAGSPLADGALVVQLDWEDFPVLFRSADRLRYYGGHDPAYGLLADERRWRLLDDLHDGRRAASSGLFRDEFGAAAVVVPTHCASVIASLRSDDGAREEYGDAQRRIFLLAAREPEERER